MSESTQIEKKPEHPAIRMLNTPNMRAQIAAALPKHITPERVIRVAITALRVPKIAECSPASLLACIMQSAQLGLELNDGLGRAYIVPFKRVATLIIGYQGMIDLAQRSGKVGAIKGVPVFAADAFEYEEGLEPRLVHKPNLDGRHDPELLRAVYGIATIALTHERQFVVLNKLDVEAARKRGASGRDISTPWDTDYVAMAQKTSIRRLYKFLPKSAEMARAESLDEAPDVRRVQTFDAEIVDIVGDAAHHEGAEPLANGGTPIEANAESVVDVPASVSGNVARAKAAARATVAKVEPKPEEPDPAKLRAEAIARGEDPDQ